MNKPTKPNITIPESFAANGVKADFDNNKILNGFDRIQPDVLAGDNLNKFIDDTYKGLNYSMAASDALNILEDGHTLVYEDGQFKSKLVQGLDGKITNCLLEVPQRIKYTFENGTFTLLKGSVMIFPHGTTDLSSSYPVGSNYYNSNFKVVDRQYANGLFFVWAEMQADKTTSQTGTATADSNILYVNAERNTFGFNGAGAVFSGTTKPTAGQIWYDTTNNVLNYSNDNFATYTQLKLSFPICNFAREASAITNINQVFNGMGYIGSSQWYDKDIVGLSPNGLNSDGTYNNAEIRRTRLTVRTFGTETTTNSYNWQLSSNAHRDLKDYYVQDTQPALSGNWLWHDTSNNKLYGYTDSTGLIDMSGTFFVGGFGTRTNGVVTSFNPKQTFRAVDWYDYNNEINTINSEISTINNGVGSAKAYITQTYTSGASWYRVWSDGWCEQGGKLGALGTVTFLKPFQSTNYCITAIKNRDGADFYPLSVSLYTTTQATFASNSDNSPIFWRACGYIA